MTNITTALLDFLMGLLKNPEAGAEFAADPDTALHNAGLNGICAADVDAVLPVALDFSPVGNREYDTGGNTINSGAWGGGGGGGNGGGGNWGGGGGGGGGGHWGGGKDHHDHGDYAAAKAKLLSVVHNYSYIDDRDVINDQSVNTNIWAEDSIVGVNNEVENTATNVGDGSIVATTGGTVIAGNTEYDLEVDIEDSFNEENELEIEDSFNDNSDNSTNTDNSTNVVIEDSFNEEVEIEDSFNETETEIDVDIEDSFNEDSNNETDVEVDIEDSFNEDNSVDNSVNTEVDLEVEDSFNGNNLESGPGDLNANETETEVEVDVEDSFNGNDIETGPGDQVQTDVEVEESFNDNNLEQGGGDLTDVEVEVEDVTL
jgi:hypothetical protein